MQKNRKRALTGIRSSGSPHLGNYFGAFKPLIELQKDHEVFLFIADLHALNEDVSKEKMKRDSLEVAAVMLACGFDPTKNHLYCQSALPETSELAWMMSCAAPYGMMLRGHAYKDAQAKGKEINMGVFNYPILMAADIALFDADIVPVGLDQKQHLEMTRDFVGRFNNRFGDLLTMPEPKISETLAVIPGTDGQKMSKSKGNVVSIFNTDKEWKKQVMSIVTDPTPLEAPKDPEKCVVFGLYKTMASPQEIGEMAAKYRAGGYGYGHAKQNLLKKLQEVFGGSMRDKYLDWMGRPDDLREIIVEGTRKVRPIAIAKLNRLQEAMGLIGRPY